MVVPKMLVGIDGHNINREGAEALRKNIFILYLVDTAKAQKLAKVQYIFFASLVPLRDIFFFLE